MINILITSKYLSMLLVPIVVFIAVNYNYIRKRLLFLGVSLASISVYSIVGLLPFSNAIKLNISVCSLSCLIAVSIYQQLLPVIDKAQMRQKKRALKKIPFFIVVIFYSLSNFLPTQVNYAMVALALFLLERSYRVALFSWPFVIIGFSDSSVIMEGLIIFSQTVSIFMLKEKNE